MRLSLLVLVAAAMAKNVVQLPQLTSEQMKQLDLEIRGFPLAKRDAKNVYDITVLGFDESSLHKREAKNVADLHLVLDEASLVKRDGKNVVDLTLIPALESRDAKNVVNLDLTLDDDGLFKRDACHMKVKIHQVEVPDNLKDLKFKLNEKIYEVEEQPKNQFANEISLKLKPWTESVRENLTFDLSSLNGLLSHLESKVNAILDSDKLKGNSKQLPHLGELESDLATAMNIREDVSIFSNYVRQLSDLYTRCEIPSPNTNSVEGNDEPSEKGSADDLMLVFAPTNEALLHLKFKPWSYPTIVDRSASEEDQAAAIESNIRNFVEGHIFPIKSSNGELPLGEGIVELTSINGNSILLKNDKGNGFWVLADGSQDWIMVNGVDLVKNGALLNLDEVLVKA